MTKVQERGRYLIYQKKSPEKCKKLAQKWLGFLRNGYSPDAYGLLLYSLREELGEGSLSLADIGTSEEELEELRVKNERARKGIKTHL